MKVGLTVSYIALAGALVTMAAAAGAQTSAEPANAAGSGADPLVPTQQESDSVAVHANAITGKPDSADDSPSPNAIIVTGTRIVRPNSVSAAPITSVTAQDIRAQAPVSIEEVMNRLPQVAPDSQSTYQDSDGRQRIKLRSLGFERTLVLIDGKRLGTQNGQDSSIIPISLLDRVDVLTGGASSVYGSDAVAGVVNFILKPDFTGVRLDANYNFFNHNNRSNIVTSTAQAAGFSPAHGMTNDGGRTDVTLTAGTKLLDDKLKVSGFVNYKHSDLVPYDARSTSACQLVQLATDGPVSCTASTYSRNGYISPRSGASSGVAFNNNPNGSRTFVPYGASGTATNPYDGYSYQRQANRVNAGGFATLTLSPAAEIYGSALWFRDNSINVSPTRVFSYTVYGDTPYQVNCNNPFLSASQATTLCGAAAGTAVKAPLEVRYRFGSDNLIDRYINSGIRATGGVRGKIGDAWTYDFGGVYARNQQITKPASLPNFDSINNALNVVNVNGKPTCVSVIDGSDPACVPFDAFSAGNTNGALLNYIYNGQQERSKTVNTLYDGLLSVTGDLGKYGITSPLAKDGVAVAFGGEFRKETLKSTANAAYRADYGGSDADLGQHVWEGNIELQAPIIQEKRLIHLLQVNGGFRVSKYNVNDDAFKTWKVEGIYSPVSDITFRASLNKAQAAPTVVQVYQAHNISFSKQGGSQNDFCAPVPRQIVDPNDPTKTITTTAPLASQAVCAATGLPSNLYGSSTLLCPNDQCTVRSGGFDVEPETAHTLTYGLVLKPSFVRGLVFSVDRYQIKIDNSIGYNDDSYYYDGCLRTGDPFFCSGFVRASDGTLYAAAAGNPTSGFIRAGTTNYYYSIANGYDFQAEYALGLGSIGRVDFEFNGSLTTFAGSQDSPIQPKRNCTGYYGNGCSQLLPRWAHTLRTTYTTNNGVFNASFNWRYVGSLTSANNSGDAAIGGTPDRVRTTYYHISPQSYFDLALTFNVAKRASIRLIANNLLDKSAPILPNSYDIGLARSNTIPARYDSLGRNLAISVSTTF